MTIELVQSIAPADEKALESSTHILFVLPVSQPGNLPFEAALITKLKRSHSTYGDLLETMTTADLPGGALAAWVVLDAGQTVFQRHTNLRKAIKPLLDEKPEKLTIAVFGDNEALCRLLARDAYYVALVNAQTLPTRKAAKKPLQSLNVVDLYGAELNDADLLAARASGNVLSRTLTMLPPNELTPGAYRQKIAELAREHGWQCEEYDIKALQGMGAGAFVAVGQGSEPQDAAIVHLRYSPHAAKKHIALVGKGICFDTGGHNLKPARYMNGMHEDMNGSAVALGILLAATQSRLPVRIDCWLAIAQNHVGPGAYKQNDVITALNGTTIEIVHTDAEGRMVLADTLTLASRAKPELIMDFATLTGSMITAVGTRFSGILGNRPTLLGQAVEAGGAAGERVCAFPFDEDYDEDIDSTVADVKQCTLDSEADHVLAARFLSRFIEGEIPWLHVDLSAANRKGGLGAVASDVNGFGVGFGLELMQRLMAE